MACLLSASRSCGLQGPARRSPIPRCGGQNQRDPAPWALASGVLASASVWVRRRCGPWKRHGPRRTTRTPLVRLRGLEDADEGAAGAAAGALPPELGEWCALYINLDRRADRKGRLEKLLAQRNGPLLAKLERAIDKEALSFDDEMVLDAVSPSALERARRAMEEDHYTVIHDEEGNLVHFDDHLTLGGIACALSHRKALRRIAEHPTAEWGLVLEERACRGRRGPPWTSVLVTRADLPDDWDAVCLAYHDEQGRVHPSAVNYEESYDGVRVLASPGHVFGLGAWMVRKEAALQLVEHAFPIQSQVDYTLTSWLAQFRRRLWKVDPRNLLFYCPSSEEEMDSDVQTMAPIAKIEEEHQSLQAYLDYMNGRPSDPYADWDFDLDDEGLFHLLPGPSPAVGGG
eukprot:g32848.t1